VGFLASCGLAWDEFVGEGDGALMGFGGLGAPLVGWVWWRCGAEVGVTHEWWAWAWVRGFGAVVSAA